MTDFFVTVGRGDEQGLPVLSVKHINWTSNSWMGSNISSVLKLIQVAYLRYQASRLQQEELPRPVIVVFGLVAAEPALGG